MAQDDAQADGYYAEDNMGADELDLSFLDEKEDKADGTAGAAPNTPKPDAPKK